jgi:hypothetical protein
MGFLTRSAKGEDTGQSENASAEEQYERLFPKIGRDFVSRRDFVNIMQRLMAIVDPTGLSPIDFEEDGEARNLAIEYKSLLDSGKNGANIYKDLIRLDDDEEEEEE